MGDKTGITWTDATWNPTTGCAKVSPACKNCYADRDWHRLVHLPAYQGRKFTDVACHPERLDQPLRWKRPRRIFVNSLSDLFHEAVPDEFIDQVFAVMACAGQHTFQILTKRPERMRAYMTRLGGELNRIEAAARQIGRALDFNGVALYDFPLPNVWMGVSVENQATADERIPLLLQTPAAVRFISAEPLLTPVNLALACSNRIRMNASGTPEQVSPNMLDWVIVGGESGSKARFMHPAWARALKQECENFQIPFFFKQTGLWQFLEPGEAGKAEYKHATTRFVPELGATFLRTKGGGSDELDGRVLQEWPHARKAA